MRKAILLSGGVDSISVAFWKRPQVGITIDYGQCSAPAELRAARTITEELNIQHVIFKADMSGLGAGTLAGRALPSAPTPEWWPYRNQLLITIGGALALREGCHSLLIGSIRDDDQYVDGTYSWLTLMNNIMKMQEGELEIEFPAISMTSLELVRKSCIPNPLLAWSHSCNEGETACGKCRSCSKQIEVFAEVGLL